MRDLGAGGVKIGDGHVRDRKFVLVKNCEVRDCLVSEGGRVDPAGVGVWIGHAVGNTVAHCTIRDMYYSGISAGWNWGFAQTARDNVLEWNHIYDIGRHVLSDMGGIYLLGRQPGTVERYNHIHHVTRARNCAFGVYFDSGTSLVTVTNNVVHDCEDTNFFLAAISASNRVENNVFVCGPRVQVHALPRNPSSRPTLFARNILAWDGGKFTYSQQGEDTIAMRDNLYWCPDDIRPKEDPRGCTYAPIRFADLAARDLRLADTNVATKAGFIPFSIDGCGKTTPVSLTADMPKVPDVFFAAPEPIIEDIREDFEEVPVGTAFPGWSVLQPDGTNTIRVTERFAAAGRRSLEVIDDKKDWRPHFSRSVYRPKGRWKISFALMVEGGAQPRIELRGDGVGFPLRVAADGMLTSADGPLMKIEEGKWHTIAISLALGKGREKHVCTVTVKPHGADSRAFQVPFPPTLLALHWIGIYSCGAKGRYYLDDFVVAKDGK
ncbi:MAG: right-handed parallel beta-helix repeat-containing protein [Kiritimatiellae bacterium]|nr:right-handed parallel beta-helix repeat-containing protein [Kiritimatiellia bacterium]